MAQSSEDEGLFIKNVPIHGVSFLVPARIILPLFLRCQGLPCLQRLLGQDDDSHMLFTAGLEAPLKQQHMNIH